METALTILGCIGLWVLYILCIGVPVANTVVDIARPPLHGYWAEPEDKSSPLSHKCKTCNGTGIAVCLEYGLMNWQTETQCVFREPQICIDCHGSGREVARLAGLSAKLSLGQKQFT